MDSIVKDDLLNFLYVVNYLQDNQDVYYTLKEILNTADIKQQLDQYIENKKQLNDINDYITISKQLGGFFLNNVKKYKSELFINQLCKNEYDFINSDYILLGMSILFKIMIDNAEKEMKTLAEDSGEYDDYQIELPKYKQIKSDIDTLLNIGYGYIMGENGIK